MKRLKKYWLFLIAASCLVVTCVTIEDVTHPANAVINSNIDIVVRIKVVAETDRNSKLAFGVWAPVSWDIAGSATLTLTTTAGFADNAVTNEPLTVISTTETDPSNSQSWPASFQTRFGAPDGNPEPMEWVVFESNTTFQLNDTKADQATISGTVNIKLHTGDNPVTLTMGYAFLGKDLTNDYNGQHSMFKALEIKDARFISFGPATFGFGDIFSIKYTESHTKPAGSAHRGGDVYLLGEVKYSVDSEPMDKQIDETGTKTLMEDLGDVGQANAWQKYIYPKDFFDLPENAVIEEIHVYFVNLDKSIISAEYQVTPTCQ